MAKQINPGLARIWHSANVRQYGYSNPTLIRIDSEAQHRAIDLLETGVTNSQFESLGKIAKIKDLELETLLARVLPVLANTSSFLPTMDAAEVEARFAEITNLFLLGFADPAKVMANRKSARVFVSSIGRAGLLACRALYTAGIGTILTFDAKRVSPADTGEIGYSKQLIGLSRLDALKQTLGKTRSEIQLHSRMTDALESVSAAILLANDAINPDKYQPWMSRETPHIGICFTEAGSEISQLVLPGVTSCLACSEIARMREDQAWLRTATQLAQLDRDLADAATLLISVGVAVRRILEVIDGEVSKDQIQYCYDRNRTELLKRASTEINCGCR